eukprot:6688106-Prymnesium_polylepis.1
MVPFSMLLLQALLPSCAGDPGTTLTRLYELLERTEAQLKEAAADAKLARNLGVERQQTVLALVNVFSGETRGPALVAAAAPSRTLDR